MESAATAFLCSFVFLVVPFVPFVYSVPSVHSVFLLPPRTLGMALTQTPPTVY